MTCCQQVVKICSKNCLLGPNKLTVKRTTKIWVNIVPPEHVWFNPTFNQNNDNLNALPRSFISVRPLVYLGACNLSGANPLPKPTLAFVNWTVWNTLGGSFNHLRRFALENKQLKMYSAKFCHGSPLLTSIPGWISNCMLNKMWMKLLIHSQTSTGSMQ